MARKAFLSFLIILASNLGVMAIVDSMDYGNNTMEWRSFVTDGPVTAFAQTGNSLWYATASGVGIYSIKNNSKQVLTSLGEFGVEGVTDMAADSRGGVWIASGEGVAYSADGARFTNYTQGNGLADNAVTCLHVAEDGSVWAGTEKGACEYRNGAWKKYGTADGVCGNSIRDIDSDNSSRTVWLATNNGVAVYKNGAWSKYDKNSGMSSSDVKVLVWDPRKKDLWMAVGKSDVNNFDGTEWNVFMDVQADITSIMADTQSRVWVGSAEGIIKYNGFEWIFDSAKMPFPAAVCNAMYRDDGGNLWFGIDTGVMRLQNPYPY